MSHLLVLLTAAWHLTSFLFPFNGNCFRIFWIFWVSTSKELRHMITGSVDSLHGYRKEFRSPSTHIDGDHLILQRMPLHLPGVSSTRIKAIMFKAGKTWVRRFDFWHADKQQWEENPIHWLSVTCVTFHTFFSSTALSLICIRLSKLEKLHLLNFFPVGDFTWLFKWMWKLKIFLQFLNY